MSIAKEKYLNLLLFSIEDVHFGVDAEQVIEVETYEGEPNEDLFWFHRELGYSNDDIKYSAPAIITMKSGNGRQYRVIIDAMEDITVFSQNNIHPFPPLLEGFTLPRGMWGILNLKGRLILLVDLLLVLSEKSRNGSMEFQSGGVHEVSH